MSIWGSEQREIDEVFAGCVQDRRAMLNLLDSVKAYLPTEHQITVEQMAGTQSKIESYVSSRIDGHLRTEEATMKASAESWANTLKDK